MSEIIKTSRTQSIGMLIYGVLAYLGFHAVFLYMILFLNGFPLPGSISGSSPLDLPAAIAVNLSLVLLFGVQHAIMARPAFKEAWTRIIPEPIERSTFVLVTVFCLGAAMVLWQPIEGSLFRIESPAFQAVLYGLQAIGWGIVVWSTFLIDHFELFGLRQIWCAFRGRELPTQIFRMPALYRYSRHPMMVGMLIGFWSTPDMSQGRLLWALSFSFYILLGIRIEERDLVRHLGNEYRTYQRRVGRLVPFIGRLASKP